MSSVFNSLLNLIWKNSSPEDQVRYTNQMKKLLIFATGNLSGLAFSYYLVHHDSKSALKQSRLGQLFTPTPFPASELPEAVQRDSALSFLKQEQLKSFQKTSTFALQNLELGHELKAGRVIDTIAYMCRSLGTIDLLGGRFHIHKYHDKFLLTPDDEYRDVHAKWQQTLAKNDDRDNMKGIAVAAEEIKIHLENERSEDHLKDVVVQKLKENGIIINDSFARHNKAKLQLAQHQKEITPKKE